jgi:multisubunit Na+/H+ antiporter MnhB subunit
MVTGVRRTGWFLALRLGVAFTAAGGICVVASVLVAFLIADHSSSESSPSSLAAIGLGGLGVLSVLLGALVLSGLPWRSSGTGPAGPRTAHPAGVTR